MNKDKVMAMVRKKSEESGVSINTLLLLYFFERFMAGIPETAYKADLILKGGVLLSSMLGIETRTTTDMDMALEGKPLDEDIIRNIFETLAVESSTEDTKFEIVSIEEIKIDDKYPGYRIGIVGRLQNIRQPFSVDIATGDPITPKAIEYSYRSVFDEGEEIRILSYNLETIIAEKLETIVSRKTDNSRSKDFYDLYTLFALKRDAIDLAKLKAATNATFTYRETPFSIDDIINDLENIRNNEGFRGRWKTYCKKNEYVEPIEFDELLDKLEEDIKEIYTGY